jgi:tRNA A37 threonylcarbamoyladenosine modification protein TsaB
MRILLINLASHSALPHEGGTIACVTEDETAAIRFIDHRIGDNGILPIIDEVLTEAAWTDKDLTHIACIVGPGGFTSLRMAVTLANTYADQLHIPSAGIHMSDLYRERADGDFIWIHATKKQELFVRGFGVYEDQWKEPVLIGLEQLVDEIPKGAIVAGEILPDQRIVLEPKKLKDAELKPIADVLPAYLSKLSYNDQILLPWYGRGW